MSTGRLNIIALATVKLDFDETVRNEFYFGSLGGIHPVYLCIVDDMYFDIPLL